ncbi:TPA: hypothetical protein IBW23_002292 [Escherichia coli]|nr:hypothetical protein A8M62_15530 [Escherichia coli]RCQ43077.1 hypothetical protein BEA13_17670 [Escherichia coli]HAH2538103.1 hypothetical protein [Escherichia coli]HAI0747199.1 hypothetical protein [Escherichia coli]HAM4502540.1 hypothetical protein [Escherichia coli]
MPVTEAEVRERFNAIAADEGIITNTSRMSPFWRLITAIVTAPVMWLKDVLVLSQGDNANVSSGNHCDTAIRSNSQRRSEVATCRQNKSFADKNGTTPHPPAVSGSINFFSFIFLQTRLSSRASTGGFAENPN